MLRFTIRELVLLTLVVAMGVAWWLDRRDLAEALQNARAAEVIANAEAQMSFQSHVLPGSGKSAAPQR